MTSERTKDSCDRIMRTNLNQWDSGSCWKELARYGNLTLNQHIKNLVWDNCDGVFAYEVADRFCAKPAEKDPALMSIYENQGKYISETRLIGKPGKIIKRIFPFLNPTEVESFVSFYKENFVLTDMGFTVKSGKDRDSFKHAYAGNQSPTSDCKYDFQKIKSLSASCMRHSFDSLPCHPTEVYASGDFVIYWIEDKQERIAARCIVYNGKYAGPIYTNSTLAFKTLESHLESLGITDFDCEFDGAKILRIETREYSDSFVMPYVDGISYAEYYDESHWVLTNDRPDCDYLESTQEGACSINGGLTCEDCGESMSEDDSTYINDSCICSDCLNANYKQCESDGDWYPSGEMVEVYYYNSWGGIRSSNYHQDNLDSVVYCDNENEYWDSGSVVWIESEEIHVPRKIAESDYFVSTVDSEYYSDDQKVKTELGDMTEEQAKESDLTLVGEMWIRTPEAYTLETTEATIERHYELETIVTTTLVLRDNFELDANGIPQKNPDFLDMIDITPENCGLSD